MATNYREQMKAQGLENMMAGFKGMEEKQKNERALAMEGHKMGLQLMQAGVKLTPEDMQQMAEMSKSGNVEGLSALTASKVQDSEKSKSIDNTKKQISDLQTMGAKFTPEEVTELSNMTEKGYKEGVYERLNQKKQEALGLPYEQTPEGRKMKAEYKMKMDLERQKTTNKVNLENANPMKGLTPGEKNYDNKVSTKLAEWNTGGKYTFNKNIEHLEAVREKLIKSKEDFANMTSGRFSGRLPDWMRTNESLAMQQDVHSAAVSSLKQLMGPQFTEKEGTRIMNMSYDPTLEEEQNIAKIDATIKELKDAADALEQQGQILSQRGTLKNNQTSSYQSSKTPPKTEAEEYQEYLLLKKEMGNGD